MKKITFHVVFLSLVYIFSSKQKSSWSEEHKMSQDKSKKNILPVEEEPAAAPVDEEEFTVEAVLGKRWYSYLKFTVICWLVVESCFGRT